MSVIAGLPAKLSFEQAYNLDRQAPFRLYFPEESARHVVEQRDSPYDYHCVFHGAGPPAGLTSCKF